MKSSFMKCESLIMSKFEYDLVSSKIATFQDPWMLKVITPLNYNKFDCVGTYDFAQNFLTYNIVEKGATQFNHTIAALDHVNDQIKIWSVGTGKIIDTVNLGKQEYLGFKFHNKWEDYSLIYKTTVIANANANSNAKADE